MEIENKENTSCCTSSSCGCHIDAYTTSRGCPDCGKKLRLTGKAQLFELRLTCVNCGYTGPLLSPQEIAELI